MLDEKETLILDVRKAESLHGHLGPFLVIGVKMARLAKKTLNINGNKWLDLQVLAKLPLITPFSCILDGIQATTQCTVGNRRLKIKNSNGAITALFKLKSQDKALKIHVKSRLIEMLRKQLSMGMSNEKLAWTIADMSEDEMFEVKTDKALLENNSMTNVH
ncbi:MAG: formylmethanofuran dehydrogenase subunit E family protein [Candidatus Bathyarchaeota archaeon]|nr:formylmethanofuran dehydrogenase subunit E family protein [Candidatus Bathyarchaeota archaeon]MDW8040321.1 formylmethanofuran dehydrogenase subunit E family protein [Nitrososphaerota archaeon]